jgi:hypothetical protein
MKRLRALLGAAAMMAVLPGCAATIDVAGSPSGAPECPGDTARHRDWLNGPLLLTAQSVPSASLVPCLHRLPVGWTFREMNARSGRTQIALDFGRDSDKAAKITLTRSCDPGDAAARTSDRSGAQRYDRTHDTPSGYRGARYYLFRGGCVVYEFDLRGGSGTQAVATIARALDFVDRATLDRSVRDYSNGRFELNHTSGR